MTRAYIRLDPAFDERKEAYPDGPYAALVATFCLSEHQPQRGRFRSLDYLARLLGKRGRHLKYLVAQGDVVVLPDGKVYVDGWDEWQEGDWKVSERVGRIRGRKSRTEPVTPDVTVPVTVDVTPDVTVDRLSGSGGGAMSGDSSGGGDNPRDPWDDPEGEAVTWLAKHGCALLPHSGYYRNLVTMVEHHGINAVVGMFDRLAAAGTKTGDVKGYVFGAKDALDAKTRPSLGDIVKTDRAEESVRSSRRAVDRTQQYLKSLRGEAL